MAISYQLPITPNQTFFTDQGVINAGGLVYVYQAGSLNPQVTYTTSAIDVANPNPIVLNSAGRLPAEVWVPNGVSVKLVFKTAAGVSLSPSVYDNISAVNDVVSNSSVSEWVTGTTPSYGSTTSFTVTGNQVGVYTQGRRVRASVNAGIVHGTVINAVFTSVTTVTLRMDGTQLLDNGLTSVSYGLFDPQAPSYMLEQTYADAGGTANAITATFYGPEVNLVEGSLWEISALYANTQSAVTLTLTLNTVVQATLPIVKGNGAPLVAGDIQPRLLLLIAYDQPNNVFILNNPATGTIGESVSVVNPLGNVTGAKTIDIQLGDFVYGTITGNTTFTFANPAPSGFSQGFTLELINGGAFTINWPASVKWAGGSAPALTASGTDVIVFETRNAGTTWFGFLVGKGMA